MASQLTNMNRAQQKIKVSLFKMVYFLAHSSFSQWEVSITFFPPSEQGIESLLPRSSTLCFMYEQPHYLVTPLCNTYDGRGLSFLTPAEVMIQRFRLMVWLLGGVCCWYGNPNAYQNSIIHFALKFGTSSCKALCHLWWLRLVN